MRVDDWLFISISTATRRQPTPSFHQILRDDELAAERAVSSLRSTTRADSLSLLSLFLSQNGGVITGSPPLMQIFAPSAIHSRLYSALHRTRVIYRLHLKIHPCPLISPHLSRFRTVIASYPHCFRPQLCVIIFFKYHLDYCFNQHVKKCVILN